MNAIRKKCCACGLGHTHISPSTDPSFGWRVAQRSLQNDLAPAACASDVDLNQHGEGHLVVAEPFGMPLRRLARP
jgi:hypothetical protein